MRAAVLVIFAVPVSMSVPTSAEDLVLLHAAGSLRGALIYLQMGTPRQSRKLRRFSPNCRSPRAILGVTTATKPANLAHS
jgi:hypothetical protein